MPSDEHHREELKSTIYTAILGKIMTGELSPGERLVEEDLARDYGVSRTPIREILFALERDGLIERIHNRGARVAAFTPDDLEQIYDIRSALECLALRRAVKTMPLNELLEFERSLEALDKGRGARWRDAHLELDRALHRFIRTHSRNGRLIALAENISLLVESLGYLGYRSNENVQRAAGEHAAIVRALLRRDLNESERLLAEHIESSKRNALEFFLRRSVSRGRSPAKTGS